ncbi:hypothetical protein CYMTET_42267 [Cymbomonas tetramitiformis]|uniref:Uncharacterized protein n=1 Tax=Cymbomonas tetramitiformis TaxID=36881 RepID=A0AAE0C6K7_9CHLO|nr:hypothetical protein CYMTET_42267 [Cymbomonas tetramitiformis]
MGLPPGGDSYDVKREKTETALRPTAPINRDSNGGGGTLDNGHLGARNGGEVKQQRRSTGASARGGEAGGEQGGQSGGRGGEKRSWRRFLEEFVVWESRWDGRVVEGSLSGARPVVQECMKLAKRVKESASAEWIDAAHACLRQQRASGVSLEEAMCDPIKASVKKQVKAELGMTGPWTSDVLQRLINDFRDTAANADIS